MDALKNFIDGKLEDPTSNRHLDNVDPATGDSVSLVPDSDAADIERAVAAAERAFPSWSRRSAAERSAYLLEIADLIERRVDEFARAECVDTGKPLSLARSVDIPRSVKNLRFFATAVLHTRSDFHRTDAIAFNYTLRSPRGVAGLISPWNLPLLLLTWKIAPALATGNTAVAKPSELTPTTAYLLSQVCREANLPPGVLNVVHGLGSNAGAALVAHPKVSAISFTGGTATGKAIARTAADQFKRVSLELGGKNPTIVFADADMDAAIEGSIRSAFTNQGQVCLCGSRILVERSVFSGFVDRFVAWVRTLGVGDPLESNTDQGAIASKLHLEKITRYVELAREEGGEILCGGAPPTALPDRCRRGFFFQPTVIVGLTSECRVNQEEIFGPVVTILPFEDEDAAVSMANSTEYGLSASIWTQSLSRAHRLGERIEAGTVWVNCWNLRDLRVPFGGMKQSGVGREGGDEALRFFTEPKNICIQIAPDEA